jgi:hypothetical protein
MYEDDLLINFQLYNNVISIADTRPTAYTAERDVKMMNMVTRYD